MHVYSYHLLHVQCLLWNVSMHYLSFFTRYSWAGPVFEAIEGMISLDRELQPYHWPRRYNLAFEAKRDGEEQARVGSVVMVMRM